MINELVLLADAIEEAGITPPDWHKNFKELPKASRQKPCFRLEVGENGRIERIRVIPFDAVPYLRKWEKSNGHSFPGFNIVPPFRIAIKERLEIMRRWAQTNTIDLALLESWCSDPSSLNDRKKSDPKLRNSIDKVPFEEILPLLGDLNDMPVLQLLIGRLEPFRGPNAATLFMNSLTECIWRELKTGNDPNPLLSLLCHKGNPEKNAVDDRGSASVYLDVVHPSGSRVAHQSMMALINARLMAKASEKTAGIMGNRKDAFGQTVSPDELLVKQPPVKLPVLGNTILRSMAGDSGCQRRYGKTDAKSFPEFDTSEMESHNSLGHRTCIFEFCRFGCPALMLRHVCQEKA